MIPSDMQLVQLPDELLLIILKQLRNTDVLYSLFGLDTRLDQVLRDHCLTNEIDFIHPIDSSSRQMERFVDRFCLDILPNIDHLITRLKVQLTLMERILRSADYSNLSQLEIFIQHVQPVLHINGKKILS